LIDLNKFKAGFHPAFFDEFEFVGVFGIAHLSSPLPEGAGILRQQND